MPVRVVEFRSYRLRPGVREAFIEYFEEHFLDSQEKVGMRVLGQEPTDRSALGRLSTRE